MLAIFTRACRDASWPASVYCSGSSSMAITESVAALKCCSKIPWLDQLSLWLLRETGRMKGLGSWFVWLHAHQFFYQAKERITRWGICTELDFNLVWNVFVCYFLSSFLSVGIHGCANCLACPAISLSCLCRTDGVKSPFVTEPALLVHWRRRGYARREESFAYSECFNFFLIQDARMRECVYIWM